ncbi:unnamed protein product [Owenia fusiformis]|uniref:Uncharacterized protein n=1 Tax=Owenia fusiformis TaxID=6347 RepID=A0A8J1TE78_OWEFU|nr:unnamed protein product [Owenia fusiformis]
MMLKEVWGLIVVFMIQRTTCDETEPSGTNECLELHPGFKECGITPNGINGKWRTSFKCGDKDFNGQLEITFAKIDGGGVNGEFTFWTKDGVSGDQINGKHEVKGTLDTDSGGLTLLGIKWIVQPPDWSAITCENNGMCITNGSVSEDQKCCCTKGFTGRTCNTSSVPETTTQNEAASTTAKEAGNETTVTPNSTNVIQETTMEPKMHASQETTKAHASQETNSTQKVYESTFGTTLMSENMTITPPKIEPPLTAAANTFNQRRTFAFVFIIHMLREIISILK